MKKFFILLFLLSLSSYAYSGTCTFGLVEGNYSDNTKWVLGSAPTSADDVLFISTSANCNITSAAAAKTVDCTGYTGALTQNTGITWTISGDMILASGMTYTPGSTSLITFNDNATLTPNGVSLANVTFSTASKTYTIASALNQTAATKVVTLTAGTLLTDGADSNQNLTHNWGSFSSSNANTRVLTLGNNTIYISASGLTTAWTFQNPAGLTFNANSSTINFTGATTSATIHGGNRTFNNLIFSQSGTPQIGSTGITCSNFTRIGTASTTNGLQFNNPLPNITNSFTVTGNSNINRLLVTSNILGTSTYINATTYSINNTDFRDIQGGNGTVDWNLAAYSVGNAGGNSNITFTPAEPQKWAYDTGSWSNSSKWLNVSDSGAGRVPLPQDNVFFDASSFTGTSTVTSDVPRLGRTIDWSQSLQTTSWTVSTAGTIYGGLDMTGLNTVSNMAGGLTFEGRGVFNLNAAGLKFVNKGVDFSMFGGEIKLLSDIATQNAGTSFNINNGIFNASDEAGGIYNLSSITIISSGTRTRTIYMGGGNWNLTGSAGITNWNFVIPTNLNLYPQNSTIIAPSTFNSVFGGGNLTYNNISVPSNVTTNYTIAGNNTFNKFLISAPKIVRFTDGSINTITSLVANGTGLGLIQLNGTSTAGWYINSTQPQQVYNCTIAYSNAGGGGTWLARESDLNVNVTGNTGWDFSNETAGGFDDSQVIMISLRDKLKEYFNF
jgi:hypothetical protein